MRITNEHYEYIRREMMNNSKAPLLQTYLNHGLSEKQWRWDWYESTPGLTIWIQINVYPYANDNHLDTVLKKITGGI